MLALCTAAERLQIGRRTRKRFEKFGAVHHRHPAVRFRTAHGNHVAPGALRGVGKEVPERESFDGACERHVLHRAVGRRVDRRQVLVRKPETEPRGLEPIGKDRQIFDRKAVATGHERQRQPREERFGPHASRQQATEFKERLARRVRFHGAHARSAPFDATTRGKTPENALHKRKESRDVGRHDKHVVGPQRLLIVAGRFEERLQPFGQALEFAHGRGRGRKPYRVIVGRKEFGQRFARFHVVRHAGGIEEQNRVLNTPQEPRVVRLKVVALHFDVRFDFEVLRAAEVPCHERFVRRSRAVDRTDGVRTALVRGGTFCVRIPVVRLREAPQTIDVRSGASAVVGKNRMTDFSVLVAAHGKEPPRNEVEPVFARRVEKIKPDLAPRGGIGLQNREHEGRNDERNEDVQRPRHRHRATVFECEAPLVGPHVFNSSERPRKGFEKAPPLPARIFREFHPEVALPRPIRMRFKRAVFAPAVFVALPPLHRFGMQSEP